MARIEVTPLVSLDAQPGNETKMSRVAGDKPLAMGEAHRSNQHIHNSRQASEPLEMDKNGCVNPAGPGIEFKNLKRRQAAAQAGALPLGIVSQFNADEQLGECESRDGVRTVVLKLP